MGVYPPVYGAGMVQGKVDKSFGVSYYIIGVPKGTKFWYPVDVGPVVFYHAFQKNL